jgi:hypothetical protein
LDDQPVPPRQLVLLGIHRPYSCHLLLHIHDVSLPWGNIMLPTDGTA